jgi:hypothetical protein
MGVVRACVYVLVLSLALVVKLLSWIFAFAYHYYSNCSRRTSSQ